MIPISRMFGIELEFFLIDREGNIANEADLMLNALNNQLLETNVSKEAGKSMIELVSFPHRSSREVFGKFFKDFETFLYELEVNDLGAYSYGTYPGRNTNVMRKDKRYDGKRKILGNKNFEQAGKCIGFHYHYSLPRKCFNRDVNFFYLDVRKRKRRKIVNLHNLYVALDPAISTFMQSSPYFDGKLLGKDSRAIVYRGDPAFEFENALYKKHPRFGNLNAYEENFSSLLATIKERSERWKELLNEQGLTFGDFAKEGDSSLLDSSWNPVKISPHGTVESRGADMNTLSNVVAMSSMLKVLSKHVQDNAISIVPSEQGNEEPFTIEDKNLFVPQHENLLDMQRKAALTGLEDDDVYRYAKSLIDLVRKITSVEYQAPLRSFMQMVGDRKTVSDKIIEFVDKKQGYTDEITRDTTQELALDVSKNIYKDLVITRKMADKNLIFS